MMRFYPMETLVTQLTKMEAIMLKINSRMEKDNFNEGILVQTILELRNLSFV